MKAVERVAARPPRPAAPAAAPTTTRRALSRFALASLIVAVALGVAGAVVSRRAAQTAAIDDARTVTEVLAHSVIGPNLSDALVRGDPAAIRRMDQAVVGKVTTGSLVRVKLWTPEGKIVYSDEHRLIGASYPLAMDERDVLRNRTVAVELSDLEAPENRFERDQGSLLEVYLPVWTPGGRTLLFETYSRYSSVTANAGAMWRQFVPITVGALLLLQVLQVPLAWSTARRLDSSLRERERLLRRAVEATDAERRRIARDLHDGVVQDLSMPRMGGVEATRRLRADHPDVQVVVLTSFSDQELVLDAIDAGAVGYLLKDADPADLIEGLRAAAAGRSPLDPKVARTLLTRRAERAVQDQLSDREREVLVLVADGMANKQIARRLGISERTVKAHLTSIFQRIGVTDRTQAALWAERNGLRRGPA
jgi:two-component system, NarL family, sensor kinase